MRASLARSDVGDGSAGQMMRLAVAAALIAGAILAPLFLFESLVRDTVERDVVARTADERLLMARVAAASIGSELKSAGDRLEVFASSSSVQDALRARDGRVLARQASGLLRGRPNSLGGILDPAGIVLAA